MLPTSGFCITVTLDKYFVSQMLYATDFPEGNPWGCGLALSLCGITFKVRSLRLNY
jgi:hypothetical protein